jgi:hypothetical protein
MENFYAQLLNHASEPYRSLLRLASIMALRATEQTQHCGIPKVWQEWICEDRTGNQRSWYGKMPGDEGLGTKLWPTSSKGANMLILVFPSIPKSFDKARQVSRVEMNQGGTKNTKNLKNK